MKYVSRKHKSHDYTEFVSLDVDFERIVYIYQKIAGGQNLLEEFNMTMPVSENLAVILLKSSEGEIWKVGDTYYAPFVNKARWCGLKTLRPNEVFTKLAFEDRR